MAARTPILATKLRVPPASPALVPRLRLIDRLNDGLRLGRRVTLISAPAGYGKTTLLADWARRCRREVAWLALDEDDSDPARFLAYLSAALGTLSGMGSRADGETLAAGLDPLQAFSVQASLPALIQAIETIGREFVLMLDDYHLIQSSPVHDALTYLLDHQPAQMHLVIASRADPPLPLARLRARGQLTELRQGDLRFTPGETSAFVNESMRLDLDAGDVAALAARTEGWIAGLQLAATSLQTQDDDDRDETRRGAIHRFIQNFKGSNRFILDYLIEEVLQRQPPEVQAFLLRTSILDRLTGPLCDAIMGQDSAGNGQTMLEQLERANLFIIPLDDERQWYRYHRLFADLLQKRLTETDPALVPVLHRRASLWHEQHGYTAEAIDHALAAGAEDMDRAARLVEGAAEATLLRSETITLLKWINALPEEQVLVRPLLCVYHAWVLLLDGAPLEVIEERLSHAAGPSAPLALPLRAWVTFYRSEITRAIDLGRQALEQLPEEQIVLRGLAVLILGSAYHANGDASASQRIFAEAAAAGIQPGNIMVTVTAVCYQAEICRREGRLRQARQLYLQALDLAAGPAGSRLPVAYQALLGLGEIEREWNDLDAAEHHALEGVELAGRWAPAGALEGYITLMRIRQARADWSGVNEALRTMRQLAFEFKATHIDDRLVDMTEAWMQIFQGDLDGPRRWAERSGLAAGIDLQALEQGDDPLIRRIRKYEYAVAARLWTAAGRPRDAVDLLERALPAVQKINRTGLVIEYHILLALAAQAMDQPERAIHYLEHALTLAEPEGFTRLFVDEGPALARLLQQAAARRFQPVYASRLLAAFPAAAPKPAAASPLSERELEVLRLIAEGLSNEEIALKLVLSLTTIKWHTGNIYGKLNVKNRTEAVARARALGLLPTG